MAQQNEWIFRRAVQDLHVQIIGVVGEHAREREERVKRSRNCQLMTSIEINRRRRRPSCASS